MPPELAPVTPERVKVEAQRLILALASLYQQINDVGRERDAGASRGEPRELAGREAKGGAGRTLGLPRSKLSGRHPMPSRR